MVWGYVVWLVLSLAYNYYANQQAQNSLQDAVAGDVEGTTVDAASPVPVLFGTRLMQQPNLVWYGDIKTEGIKAESSKK